MGHLDILAVIRPLDIRLSSRAGEFRNRGKGNPSESKRRRPCVFRGYTGLVPGPGTQGAFKEEGTVVSFADMLQVTLFLSLPGIWRHAATTESQNMSKGGKHRHHCRWPRRVDVIRGDDLLGHLHSGRNTSSDPVIPPEKQSRLRTTLCCVQNIGHRRRIMEVICFPEKKPSRQGESLQRSAITALRCIRHCP